MAWTVKDLLVQANSVVAASWPGLE